VQTLVFICIQCPIELIFFPSPLCSHYDVTICSVGEESNICNRRRVETLALILDIQKKDGKAGYRTGSWVTHKASNRKNKSLAPYFWTCSALKEYTSYKPDFHKSRLIKCSLFSLYLILVMLRSWLIDEYWSSEIDTTHSIISSLFQKCVQNPQKI
jgi:hypothetical protein